MTDKPLIKDCRGILSVQGPNALREAAMDAEPLETSEVKNEKSVSDNLPPLADPEGNQVHKGLSPKIQTEPASNGPATKFFYDGVRYFMDTGTEYVPMDQKSVARHMKRWGWSHDVIESAVCQIQTDKYIHYAGPLAGHPRGLHTAGGVKLLATVAPEIITAQEGSWDTLRSVLTNLLNDPDAGQTQFETFLSWLKIARESLLSNRRRPGQAIAFAGPRGSGKSLLIDITELALGGRRANPYPHFTGRTNFNGDLVGAELLAVDDEAGSTDIRTRRTLAANIKACLFAGAARIEGKNKTAFTCRPFWRMLVALNDEPEALLVMPPITEDLGDKIMLFRCHKKPLPMPAHTLDEREAFFTKLREDLPGLLAYLEQWEIPVQLREERCGVKAYHHPAILQGLHELSPESQLIGLIDTAHTAGAISLPWKGTANELKTILCTAPLTSRDSAKLLINAPSAGTYLARLEGTRVVRLKLLNGTQHWKILASGQVEQVSHLNDAMGTNDELLTPNKKQAPPLHSSYHGRRKEVASISEDRRN